MLDIKLFREDPGVIKADLEKRKKDPEFIAKVDQVIEIDRQWRELRQNSDDLKAKRNRVAKEIAGAKKSGQDPKPMITSMGEINDQIKQLDSQAEEKMAQRDLLRLHIPNIMHKTVPVGDDDSENVPIRHWGEKKEPSHPLKSHQDVIEDLRLGDFNRSTRSSGAGFYYLFGDMVRLDWALMTYAMDRLKEAGFTVVSPPLMLRHDAMQGMVDMADFSDVLYKVEDEDLYLIATSEHPLGALHMGEIILEKELPLRYCGISPCFRKEIGAHGVDTRGIFRAHQFNKIEQFIYSTPDQSWDEHELLIKNAEEMFQGLDLPYRVVNICTGDLGGTAAKKYDIEVWMAKQGEYKEVVSCSNCTSYQARKLNIRVEYGDGKREVLHTLNSTAIATSRAMVAILENYQLEDGTVEVPKVLRPYMNGVEVIGKRERS